MFVVKVQLSICIQPGRQLDNPAPGSIMDHTITRRGRKDFFLISQLVRQVRSMICTLTSLVAKGINRTGYYINLFAGYGWAIPLYCLG